MMYKAYCLTDAEPSEGPSSNAPCLYSGDYHIINLHNALSLQLFDKGTSFNNTQKINTVQF